MNRLSPSHSRRPHRRHFLAATAATALAARPRPVRAENAESYRVAVIGHTGRGNYGHDLDRVWLEIPRAKLVAVADPNPSGLKAASERLGNIRGYADYRRMLDQVRPDLVSVAPRWIDQHCEMVVAAAERGVRGIYLEKPMCRTLAEADQMVDACEGNGTRLSIAFQTRYCPKIKIIEQLLQAGEIGRVIEYRSRGKEDHRGGGEDLWVLGIHMFDLMRHFGGDAQTCYGTVLTEGQPVTSRHVQEGNEGIGPLAGDEVHATYRLADGATGFFDSVRNAGGEPTRFGLRIHGSEGIIEMYNTGLLPAAGLLKDSSWSPLRTGSQWIPISSAGVGEPEPLQHGGLHEGNVLAAKELIAAIEEDRQPTANIYEARKATEMIVAVFESHRLGCPVRLPLENRRNPLTMLGE